MLNLTREELHLIWKVIDNPWAVHSQLTAKDINTLYELAHDLYDAWHWQGYFELQNVPTDFTNSSIYAYDALKE